MPKKKCVRYGSKLYCFDKKQNIVFVYPEQRYDINEIPAEVISKMINNDHDVEIIIDGE